MDGGVTFEGPHSEDLISITHNVTPSASHIQGEHFRRTLHFTINLISTAHIKVILSYLWEGDIGFAQGKATS